MRILTVFALLLVTASPVLAQRVVGTPDQRIERLERQLRQVQGRVFPGGQPVDTAGLGSDPAASQTVVVALSNRLDNLERALAEANRRVDESNVRIATLEAEIARVKTEAATPPRVIEPAPRATTPAPTAPASSASSGDALAEGEAAYDVGYQYWVQKKYPSVIAALGDFATNFPGHRRVSWANNLVGRSMLENGQARAAAEKLLANYRGNPKGERAPDSLYYLGKSLMALKQGTQACKAYAELQTVYGDTMRADLRSLLPAAKAEAGCR